MVTTAARQDFQEFLRYFLEHTDVMKRTDVMNECLWWVLWCLFCFLELRKKESHTGWEWHDGE